MLDGVRELIEGRGFPMIELKLFELRTGGGSTLAQFKDDIVITQALDTDLFKHLDLIFFGGDEKENIADELQQVEGIRSVAGELVDLVTLGPGQVVLITGWAPHSYLWNSLDLLEGSLPDPNTSGEVVVGQACSEALGIVPGKAIRIRGSDFMVSGIFRQRGA